MTDDLLPPGETDARLAAARTGVIRRVRLRRRATTALVVGGALLAAGSGIGASVVVAQVSHQEAATGVVCFAHDDLGSLSGTVAASDSVTPDGVVHRARPIDKVEACGLVWNSGLAVAAANGGHWPDVDPNVPGHFAVPMLALCRLSDGRTGAFPIEAPSTTTAAVCERLGLPVDGSA